MSKYPNVAGKTFIHPRTGSKIHIAYRFNRNYYTYWRTLPPLYNAGKVARVYGKIALHSLFDNYLEVITPCATASGGMPVSV